MPILTLTVRNKLQLTGYILIHTKNLRQIYYYNQKKVVNIKSYLGPTDLPSNVKLALIGLFTSAELLPLDRCCDLTGSLRLPLELSALFSLPLSCLIIPTPGNMRDKSSCLLAPSSSPFVFDDLQKELYEISVY